VIVATEREAAYVLDEILGNQADLPITEHATDTHGATSLLNFALFDLVALQLSPGSGTSARSPSTGAGPRPPPSTATRWWVPC